MAASLITASREHSTGGESRVEASGSFDVVFGSGEGGLPLWFNPERFLEPNFNVAEYVGDLRRSVRFH